MLSKQIQFDLLVTALEGGSNYWYFLPDLSKIPDVAQSPETKGFEKCLAARIWDAVQNGEKITVTDIDGDENEPIGYVGLHELNRADELFLKEFPEAYGDAITENYDADTADIWFQLVVMGEVIFG